MSVIGLSMPSGSGPGGSQRDARNGHGLLASMLADPLEFDAPIHGQPLGLKDGVRTVTAGPPSPLPRSRGYHDFNGINGINGTYGTNGANGTESEAGPSTALNTPRPNTTTASGLSSSVLVNASSQTRSPSTPSRKGKEPATTPNASGDSPSSGKWIHPPEVDLTWVPTLAKRKSSGAGLHNPSMACYANATLQIILHTPPVIRILLRHAAEVQERKKTNSGNECLQVEKKGFCAVCALHGLLIKHWGKSSQSSYPPKEIHGNLSRIKKGFSKSRQEDTHEFFRFLTDSFQATALAAYPPNLPAKIKHTTWVYRVWGGVVRSRVVCGRCNKPSDTFDDFLDLSLDVNKGGPAKLESMLKHFIKDDRLEGDNKYKCESCKHKSNATKSFRIQRAPPILTIHLKRFSVSYGYGGQTRTNKFTNFISYPEHLDISPYMVKPDSVAGNVPVPSSKYRLFGVTCHRGSELRFGHYTSYVKAPNNKWYHADDDEMSSVSLDSALHDKHAYLLSYMRVTDDDATSSAGTPSGTPARSLNGLSPQFPSSSHGLNGPLGALKMSNGHDASSLLNSNNSGRSPEKRKRENSPTAGLRPAKRETMANGAGPSKFRSISRPLPAPPSDDPPALPSDPPDEEPMRSNGRQVNGYPNRYGDDNDGDENDRDDQGQDDGPSRFTWQPKSKTKVKDDKSSRLFGPSSGFNRDNRDGRGYSPGTGKKGHNRHGGNRSSFSGGSDRGGEKKGKKKSRGAPAPFAAQGFGRGGGGGGGRRRFRG